MNEKHRRNEMEWTLELRDAMEDELGSLYQQLASLEREKKDFLYDCSFYRDQIPQLPDNSWERLKMMESTEDFINKEIRQTLDKHMKLRHEILSR